MTNEYLEVTELCGVEATMASYLRDLKAAQHAALRNAIALCSSPQTQIDVFQRLATGVEKLWTGNEHNGYYAYTGIVSGETWKLSPGFPGNYSLDLIN